MGSKRAHMPEQMGGLSLIRTTHHFKRTYVLTSIEYSMEPVNHAFARCCVVRGFVVLAYLKGRSLKYFQIILLRFLFLPEGKC
jgi:hypothetical protein